ncbi:MAG TPA: dihydrodipicolinate synthase family protein [Terriglobales bacterium]|nr:dihydrodipicolinate synthase family protein [Terriglobales bacterium]
MPPMMTPFGEDDRIDFSALANEARFLKKSGVSGMVVGGSMGEGAGLSEQELAEAVRTVVEAVDGTLPVLSGIIADSSAEAVRLARAARDAGAVGLQVPPPHFRPTADTPILAEYYRSITDGSLLPLIIYNVMPTAESAVESLQEIMAANPAVVGVKQSARNMHTLTILLASLRGKVKIFSAIDDMVYPSFMLGVDGTISGTSAVFPRETFEMWNAVQAKEYARALAMHEKLAPIWRVIDHPDFPGRSKYAITLMGRDVGRPRRPFRFPSGDAARDIEEAMTISGFLAASGNGKGAKVPADAR